jgi:glycosyltransferase involved in cell wall biosynthesis
MRILFITHYSALLGANRSLLTLVKGLQQQKNCEVMVLCPSEGLFTEELARNNLPFKVFPYKNWAYSYRSMNFYLFPVLWQLFKWKELPEIVSFVRQYDPDLIHSNSSVVSLGWQLAEALEKPHVWHIREYGYADYLMMHMLGNRLFYQKLQQTDQLIFISDAIRDYYLEQLTGDVRSTRIYNGVFDELTLQKSVTGKNLLIIGMLHPNKGQMDALQALKILHPKYPALKLVIAGKGWKSYEQQLRQYVAANGLNECVVFAGYVADPQPLYREAMAVLMCSRHEGMGRVTAEAMALGLPVVGFREGATQEILTASKGGLLYSSISELASQIETLYTNPEKVTELGSNGQAFAAQNFSNDAYVSLVYQVFTETLETRKG